MAWTRNMIATVPTVYRDFMRALKPIIDRRDPEIVLKINGFQLSSIWEVISRRNDLDWDQVQKVASTLRREGLIEQDRYGFIKPTASGEEFIQFVAEQNGEVPDWPAFARG